MCNRVTDFAHTVLRCQSKGFFIFSVSYPLLLPKRRSRRSGESIVLARKCKQFLQYVSLLQGLVSLAFIPFSLTRLRWFLHARGVG